MEIKGTVESIIYRNEENGYSVIEMDVNDELVACVGYFPILSEGQYIALSGEYKINPKYGVQFTAHSFSNQTPDQLPTIERYLASGIIKGVGAKTAHSIVKEFGLSTFEVIENTPKKLTRIRGISAKKADEIAASFKNIKKMQEAVMFLQGLNISLKFCLKIQEKYGEHTQSLLQKNPYQLVEDIDGIGFFKADTIARELGIERASDFRVRAGVFFVLKESSEKKGNTALPRELLIDSTLKLLGIEERERVDAVISDMVLSLALKTFNKGEVEFVALAKLFFTEKSIAARLVSLLSAANMSEREVLDEDIRHFEDVHGIEFHERQIEAIKSSLLGGALIITGGPGTGKTTIVRCILELFTQHKNTAILLAPTGRAAKRMAQATGRDASTIHRALEYEFNSGRFRRNETNPLEADVVIVDEVSMVDVYLMSALLKAIRQGATLVLVGDKDQLPSVGAGNLLSDLIMSELVKVIELKHIYRQAQSSLIITNAHRINNGEMPILTAVDSDCFFSRQHSAEAIANTIVEMTTKRIPAFKNVEPINIQVLSAMKNGTAGVDNLNNQLQKLINPNINNNYIEVGEFMRFYLGDKVMQIKNNYEMMWEKGEEEGEGVFNGDIGTVIFVDRSSRSLKVLFEDGKTCSYSGEDINQLTLAYAITIHKSQGCEFDYLIIAVTGGSPTMMTRNLLYTALTRAKKMAVLVGEDYNIRRMVANDYTAERYSLLKELINECSEGLNKLYS